MGALLSCFALTQNASAGDATLEPATLDAELGMGESLTEHKTLTLPADVTPPSADIIFVMDLTGSMGGELDQVKSNAVSMMDQIKELIPDVRFGLISHMDYPLSYSGCDYSSTYGSEDDGDYPYSLDHGLDTNQAAVATAINNLTLGYGADGPESYTRVLYELYADPAIDWREGASKLVIMWNDAIPHACDLNLCDGLGLSSTGPSPGRDVDDPADDLVLGDVLNGLVSHKIGLITLHSGSAYLDAWKCYSEKTGGDAFALNFDGTVPDGTNIADFVTGLVSEKVKHIDSIGLEVCTDGYEDWLTSAGTTYTDIDLDGDVVLDFDIEITVPEGLEPGDHNFRVCAIGDGAEYASQSLSITVPDDHCIDADLQYGQITIDTNEGDDGQDHARVKMIHLAGLRDAVGDITAPVDVEFAIEGSSVVYGFSGTGEVTGGNTLRFLDGNHKVTCRLAQELCVISIDRNSNLVQGEIDPGAVAVSLTVNGEQFCHEAAWTEKVSPNRTVYKYKP
jgi:hypothetical protein